MKHWTRHVSLYIDVVELEHGMLLDNVLVSVKLFVVGSDGSGGNVHLVVGGEGVIGDELLVFLGLVHLFLVAVNDGGVDVQRNGLPGLFVVLTSVSLDSALVVLDTVTAVLLDLACVVLVAMISGSAGAVFSVLVTQRFLKLDPGPAWAC